MILTDTGPLVALIDENDPHHSRCVAAARNLPKEPLLTTWPCITEAMYFLHKEGGYRAQQKLWSLRRIGTVMVDEITDIVADRMNELMGEYQDTPMDFADASLVAVAEALNISRLFTLDRHFYVYRLFGTKVFEIVP